MDITNYVTFDLPVPYKELKIYPITVKDYMEFNYFAQCLLIDKNSIPDAKIISMTYLEYIFYETTKTGLEKPYLIWLDRLLELCLKDEKSFANIEDSIKRYSYNKSKKPIFRIGDIDYDYKDFENIKKIIAEQNSIELIDENVAKEVRDAIEKARRYKNKVSNVKNATLEDYIVSLAVVTGWAYDYIYSMPIRKFNKALQRYDNFIHYKIYLSASMSGMVEFKDKSFIKHWLTSLEENKDADVIMDLEEIQGKISLESLKE